MTDSLETLKAELEQFGLNHDAAATDRPSRMLNITRDTGEFLAVLIQATLARRILEIGTSNGYSTLWLAEAAAQIGGQVTTIEFAAWKFDLAQANFARSGLGAFIKPVHGDAGPFLASCEDAVYDLLFLDSERAEYDGWWPDLRRVIRPGGLLIVDNAVSHGHQITEFITCIKADPEYTTCLIPVGKGEFMAVRAPVTPQHIV